MYDRTRFDIVSSACEQAYGIVGTATGLNAAELSRGGFCRELTHALLGCLPAGAEAAWELHDGPSGYHLYVGLGEPRDDQLIADLCAWQFDQRIIRGIGPVFGGRVDVIAGLRGAVSEKCLGLYALDSLVDRGSYRS